MAAGSKKSNEIKITRIYDAPVEAVWNAWTDPEQTAKWWGPRGFTLTTHSKDLRVGGTWRYTMHGPDGVDYPNKTTYFEVEKHKKLVYDHGASDTTPPLFRVTVLFHETKGRTKMDMTMTLETPEAAAETRKFIKQAGGNGTWDRLAEYLETNSTGKEKFVISRSFEVPVETMYQMWTDPKHFSKWLPPTGMEMEFLRSDMREGGSTFYVMYPAGQNAQSPQRMYGRAEYLKLTPTSQLVYTQQFCDQNEKVIRHPMAPTWPETMLTVVDLTPEDGNETRVMVTWRPSDNASKEEIETFVNSRSGMTQGWTGSLDKLEEYVEKV
jgi:uncharacterized protein YndB with AHSA1/START domain